MKIIGHSAYLMHLLTQWLEPSSTRCVSLYMHWLTANTGYRYKHACILALINHFPLFISQSIASYWRLTILLFCLPLSLSMQTYCNYNHWHSRQISTSQNTIRRRGKLCGVDSCAYIWAAYRALLEKENNKCICSWTEHIYTAFFLSKKTHYHSTDYYNAECIITLLF